MDFTHIQEIQYYNMDPKFHRRQTWPLRAYEPQEMLGLLEVVRTWERPLRSWSLNAVGIGVGELGHHLIFNIIFSLFKFRDDYTVPQ